jgi:hypothetical protein
VPVTCFLAWARNSMPGPAAPTRPPRRRHRPPARSRPQ